MSLFNKKNETVADEKENFNSDGSRFGRNVTSIKSAKEELYYKPERIDPIKDIEYGVKRDLSFYGHLHHGENKGKPLYIPFDEVTMQMYVGSTGTGKGVFLGNKIVENALRGKGLIMFDPKQDDFAPQVAKDMAEKLGLSFQVVSWSKNFGYSGINEDDTASDIANKFIETLGFTETGNSGVDYYNKNARISMRKVLEIFFNGDLGIIVKKDLNEIVKHFQYLKIDLEKADLYEKELSKNKPNNNLLTKYEKRYFDTDKVDKIYWSGGDIEAIDNIANSLGEIVNGANIYNGIDIDDALYRGGIVIIKGDLLDTASMKMYKMIQADLIQKGRKRKANVTVMADEASFYLTKFLSSSLAVTRGLGIEFSLFFQDLAQIPEEVRGAVISNCNVKFFYKISEPNTLDLVAKLGGKELVTNFSSANDKDYGITQSQEDELNTTRIRALPRAGVAIMIAEYLNKAEIIQTNFIAVKHPFKWKEYENPVKKGIFDDLKEEVTYKETDIVNYRTKIKGKVSLLEDSDLFGYEFGTEKL